MILHPDYFVDQPLQHVALIVEGQLYRDGRQFLERNGRASRLFTVFEVGEDGIESMKSVNGKDGQNAEIRNEKRPIEPPKTVNSSESIV